MTEYTVSDIEHLFRLNEIAGEVGASVDSSWITHADPRCTYGCALLNRVIAGPLKGNEDLDEAIEDCRERADGESGTDELFDAVEGVRDLEPDEVSGTGYVVDTLQASLHYALTAESFEEAVVNAVNGGGDTDTIGAVTGAIAGARFGETDIPNRWLSVTESVDTVESVAEDIHQL